MREIVAASNFRRLHSTAATSDEGRPFNRQMFVRLRNQYPFDPTMPRVRGKMETWVVAKNGSCERKKWWLSSIVAKRCGRDAHTYLVPGILVMMLLIAAASFVLMFFFLLPYFREWSGNPFRSSLCDHSMMCSYFRNSLVCAPDAQNDAKQKQLTRNLCCTNKWFPPFENGKNKGHYLLNEVPVDGNRHWQNHGTVR